MTDPYSDDLMRNLLDRDNLSNPAPFSVPMQTAQTSHSNNDCANSVSANNVCTFNNQNRNHIGPWISERVVPVLKRKRPRKNVEKPVDNSEKDVKEKKMSKNPIKKRRQGDVRRCDLDRPLRYDSALATKKFNGSKRQFWFFLLQFLVDPSKRNALSWTGNGREFVITKEGEEEFIACWSKEQNKQQNNPIKWDSITHKFRDLCREGILTKIDTNKQYTFATEPSFHVGMTPDELTEYIAQYNINSPAYQPHSKESIYAEIEYYLKQVEQEPSANSSLSPFGEEFDSVLNAYLTPAPSTESFYNFPQSSSPTPAPLPNCNEFDHYPTHPQNLSFATTPSDISEYLNVPLVSPQHPQLPSPTHDSNSNDSCGSWMYESLPILQFEDLQSLQHPYFM